MHNIDTIPPLNIIVAVDSNGGFAKERKIPWHIKEDFKHFKKVTDGHYCIMGRNTYEEILLKRKTPLGEGEDVLKGRTSIVLSRQPDFTATGATVAVDLRRAVQLHCTDHSKQIFILGGESLFVEALTWTHKIYMTVIDKDFSCDKFFPVKYLNRSFNLTNVEHVPVQNNNDTKEVMFALYTRR